MILERISDLPKEMKTSGNGQKKVNIRDIFLFLMFLITLKDN